MHWKALRNKTTFLRSWSLLMFSAQESVSGPHADNPTSYILFPPPWRLNNEQQCYLFYSVTWLKQTLTIFSKISLKLSFILASFELLHNPLRKFTKKGVYKSVVKTRIFWFPNQHFDNNLIWKRSNHHTNITTSQTLKRVREFSNQLQNITAVTFPLSTSVYFSVFSALRSSTGNDQNERFLLRCYIKNLGFC